MGDSNAAIELSDATQAIWFVELGDNLGDFMGAINTMPDGIIKLTYRLRWYRDDKPWDSKDRKQWFTGYSKDDHNPQTAIDAMRKVIEDLGSITGMVRKVHELLRGDLSTRDFMDLLLHQEFAHAKHVSQAEYEAMNHGP
jgi:hypothetical protein